jgi:dGTPase
MILAPYSVSEQKLKGRRYQDSELFFSDFMIDRDRIIGSRAFRRLEHKTQVFISDNGDHDRSRLTHSLEAAHIAKIIAKALYLCDDLAENITLAHDLGHAPFGHAGEEALNEVIKHYNISFDHNAHALKIVTQLENYSSNFPGLNLTWEFLEGLVKHNGPLFNPHPIISNYNKTQDLMLDKYASLEAQTAAISDDIAYNSHDIEDGFRSKILNIEDLQEITILHDIIAKIYQKDKNINNNLLVQHTIRSLRHIMINDVIINSKNYIEKNHINSVEDVREQPKNIICFSDEMEKHHQELKKFLMSKLYTNYVVKKMSMKGKKCIRGLFEIYMNDISCLPTSWRTNISLLEEQEKAIVICDFIAGMSDRYALSEYAAFG